VSIILLAVIEIAYNVYPSTPSSSLILQLAHLTILGALYIAPAPLALGSGSEGDHLSDHEKKE
jgi:uncharacterized membrane protein